jgi:hypothetical protein
MLHIVVGRQFLPTTPKIFTHMDHVHITLILIIVRIIVHTGDNSPIFHMSKRTPISPARDLNQIPIFTIRTRITILLIGCYMIPLAVGNIFQLFTSMT